MSDEADFDAGMPLPPWPTETDATAEDDYCAPMGFVSGWRWCPFADGVRDWDEAQDFGCIACPDDGIYRYHWRLILEHVPCPPKSAAASPPSGERGEEG